jgi:hypothetical protein
MKTKIHAALLALLLVVALPTASSEPLYAKSLDDEGVSLRVKSAAAVTRSQNELAAIAKSIIRPAAKADLDSTQTLYHVVNDLRYKAELLRESKDFKGIFSWLGENTNERYKSARAAQVHFNDLVNVLKSRLSVERSDASKSFTVNEELERAEGRKAWASQFYSYANGMKTFNDMPYQKDDVKSIISHAMKELDRAGLMRDKAFYNSYTPSVARIYKRLNDSIDAYNAYYQSIIDAKAEFNKANSNVTEMLGDEWVIDWATFNYTLPCAVENTPVTAIVVHGTNYAVRVYEQDDGSFKNRHDVSVALTDMISNCFAIAVPKSTLTIESPDYGGIEYYRQWQMSEGTPRTDEDEILAIINLINLAFESLPESHIYLVHGYDSGSLANKVTDRLRDDPNENVFKIYGNITVNTETGEYIGHNLDGTEWSSNDL